MSCNDLLTYLDAYVDGELDAVNSREVESHLSTCEGCGAKIATLRLLSTALKSDGLYFQPSEAFQARLASLDYGGVAPPEEPSRLPAPIALPPRRSWFTPLRWAGSFAAVIVAFVAGWQLGPVNTRTANIASGPANPSAQVATEIVDDHIRSLMPGHLEDVISTDQHTVKPWFDGRVDFSPPVQDLVDRGFPLLGGRLDYIDQHSAAVLVYHRAKHIINVYVWPEAGAAQNTAALGTTNGYHVVFWTQNGFQFWAVSDVAAPDLNQFAQLLQQRIASTSKAPAE